MTFVIFLKLVNIQLSYIGQYNIGQYIINIILADIC